MFRKVGERPCWPKKKKINKPTQSFRTGCKNSKPSQTGLPNLGNVCSVCPTQKTWPKKLSCLWEVWSLGHNSKPDKVEQFGKSLRSRSHRKLERGEKKTNKKQPETVGGNICPPCPLSPAPLPPFLPASAVWFRHRRSATAVVRVMSMKEGSSHSHDSGAPHKPCGLAIHNETETRSALLTRFESLVPDT